MSPVRATVLVLSALLLLLVAAMTVSCSRAVGSASVNEEFDQFGDRTHQMSAEARLLTRKGEPEYESAKAEIANGQYKSGIGNLERLVADRSIDPEIREEALLSVAEVHGSWMNPFKDYEKGHAVLSAVPQRVPRLGQAGARGVPDGAVSRRPRQDALRPPRHLREPHRLQIRFAAA